MNQGNDVFSKRDQIILQCHREVCREYAALSTRPGFVVLGSPGDPDEARAEALAKEAVRRADALIDAMYSKVANVPRDRRGPSTPPRVVEAAEFYKSLPKDSPVLMRDVEKQFGLKPGQLDNYRHGRRRAARKLGNPKVIEASDYYDRNRWTEGLTVADVEKKFGLKDGRLRNYRTSDGFRRRYDEMHQADESGAA